MEDDKLSMYKTCLLHSQMDRNLRILVARHLEDYNLSMMQWLLLEAVCKDSRNALTMSETAEILGVTLPQVTALMNELVKMKLLKQKVSSRDRRSRRLSCTMGGKKVVSKIQGKMNKAAEEWFQDIAEDDRSAYIKMLEVLARKNSGRYP